MNSYNENLQASVTASLKSQETDLKSLEANLDASTFTLYYAEGAQIVAHEQLEAARNTYIKKNDVKNKAVSNSNLAGNILATAAQQKSYTAQSVTNAAVASANIQVATNAIVRLAGDIGSIFSIINAADYGTQIYSLSNDAYTYMNETAYLAETLSQASMETSAAIAEVPSATIADKAKVTNDSVTSLLSAANTDFDAISATLAADNNTLALARVSTQKAEGVIENSLAEYKAAQSAYALSIQALNYNLSIPAQSQNADGYTVSFNSYSAPFTSDAAIAQSAQTASPVDSYYILLVKDSKKSIFSIEEAEALLLNSSQFVKIAPDAATQTISQPIKISDLLDSDNDPLALGENYVVFLLVAFTEKYKKYINCFSDYLSAPSATFVLTNVLPAATSVAVNPDGKDAAAANTPQILNFDITDPEVTVDYRCIFLPYPQNLLTELLLDTLENNAEIMVLNQQITATLNQKVTDLLSQQAYLTNLIANETNDAIKQKLTNYQSMIASCISFTKLLLQQVDNLVKAREAKIKTAYAQQKQSSADNLNNSIAPLKAQTASLKDSTTDELNNQEQQALNNIDDLFASVFTIADSIIKGLENDKTTAVNAQAFFFNLQLAEHISAGNYTSAAATDGKYSITIGLDTTDNFGTPLIDNGAYIPVVLVYYNDLEINRKQYKNALSDWANTPTFIYHEAK